MPKIPLKTINDLVKSDAQKTVADSESGYDEKIEQLVKCLCDKPEVKIVLLAGPSGSGKTTSANILKDRLIANGHQALVISLDNFYKNENEYPRKPNGEPDFETIHALDIDRIHRCLADIIQSGASYIPRFDFKTRSRNDTYEWVEIDSDGFVIVEGIHGLNPLISQTLPPERIFKLFISVSTGITDDSGTEILSGIEVRFLRRLVRDSLYRNANAAMTLSLWPDVLEGEQKYLYPYKPLADRKFDTFHVSEVGTLKNFALDVLKDHRENNAFCKRICDVLERFSSVPISCVSEHSLLREFIPGGIYESLY